MLSLLISDNIYNKLLKYMVKEVGIMLEMEYPILEFDPVSENVIEPSKVIRKADIPEKVVMCFYSEVIERLCKEGKLKEIECLHSQMGRNPIYELQYKGERVAVYQPGVGAPLGASFMEEVIALGGTTFISCGSGGVLNKDIAAGHIIVPDCAVRDEGTSYHYVKPSREIEVNRTAVEGIKKVLESHKCSYITGKTWSTDSFYRETREKTKLRKNEGCISVEMECAAFAAVAQYRNVVFGQMIYGGDDVSCDDWNRRLEFDRTDIREALFWFSVEACLSLGHINN